MTTRAKESKQIEKARKKLAAQMEEESKQITPEAIEKTSKQIQGWIDRHASERISLQDKDIALFDENRHAAKTASHYVKELREQLKNEVATGGIESLRGRVKPQESTPSPKLEQSPESSQMDEVLDDLHDV